MPATFKLFNFLLFFQAQSLYHVRLYESQEYIYCKQMLFWEHFLCIVLSLLLFLTRRNYPFPLLFLSFLRAPFEASLSLRCVHKASENVLPHISPHHPHCILSLSSFRSSTYILNAAVRNRRGRDGECLHCVYHNLDFFTKYNMRNSICAAFF